MTGKPRNPSANRLMLPLEQECRARALEMSAAIPTAPGPGYVATVLARAEVFANFIGTGSITATESETTLPGL